MTLLVREGIAVLSGRDYFHARQPAGLFKNDQRCYYNDLRAKADWTGPWCDGVPALPVPRLRRTVSFPIMILQYGLAHLDSYFLAHNNGSRLAIAAVAQWICNNLSQDGSFDNLFPILSPGHSYFSGNSAMAQGQALSFLARAARYDAPSGLSQGQVVKLLERIHDNMIRPVEFGGTALLDGDDVRYCEVCRRDRYVVLNGWIFALFGLRDYEGIRDASGKCGFAASEATLARDLATYVRKDGWSNYDNMGIAASPFYHDLHVHLLDAMGWLSADPVYAATARQFSAANHPMQRWRYMARKAQERWQRCG
jgi:hypothetical protein